MIIDIIIVSSTTNVHSPLITSMSKIIFTSGLSGAGKSTIAKILADHYNGVYLDQDEFYKQDKPLITTPSGRIIKNWDCQEALNLEAMNSKISELKKLNKPIFVAGFALRDDWFVGDAKPDYHILIQLPSGVSIETRLKIKPLRDDPLGKDTRWIFENLTVPFYNETLKLVTVDYWAPATFFGSIRRPIPEIINQLIKVLDNDLFVPL